MNKPESSVLSRLLASAYAYVAGNAPQDVLNAAEADASQVQANIDTMTGQITALTAERDGFQTQVTALSGQVISLTTERDSFKTEAEQLRQWKENHAKTTQAVVPGQDQNLTSDDVISKFPEGSLMRTALEAIASKPGAPKK